MNKTKLEKLDDYINFYENRSNKTISSVEPYIVTLRQEAYSEFCRKFNKPFDSIYFKILTETGRELCRELPGCRLGYVFTNEIDLIFTYNDVSDLRYVKVSDSSDHIASIIASKATNIFNDVLLDMVKQEEYKNKTTRQEIHQIDVNKYREKLFKATFKVDVFNFPKDMLYTYLKYKNICCMRNSLVQTACTYMSNDEMADKKSAELKQVLKDEYNCDYDSPHTFSSRFKYGVFCNKMRIDGHTSCFLIDITRPLKEGGRDKKNFETMMFGDTGTGTIESRYII